MKRLLSTLALLMLASGARAADTPPKCTYVEIADLPLRYAGDNLVPAVDGTINDTPATMLVDTGSDQTHLTMTAAIRRNLRLDMTGRWVDGVSGSSRIYSTRLKSFSVGPARLSSRIDLTVIGSTVFTPAFDAIVGAPFLLQTDLEFDLRAKHIKFYRQKDCNKTELLLWKENTVILPFARGFSRSPNPHFKVSVNGHEMDAMIDTGAGRSFITLDAAKDAGIDVHAPGARSAGVGGGIGTEKTEQWTVPLKDLKLGDETISGGELEVVAAHGDLPAELLLGQDFLRAHRVLFAMSQEKIYIAYLGGDVFPHSPGIPDWIRAEADGGNPDAQYVLATAYRSGRGVARDPKQAQAWLEQAATKGEPHASLTLGRQRMLAGHVPEAIPLLRAALDQLPSDRFGPLWLYTARVRNGEAELAKKELQANLERQQEDDWPAPIGAFYLGDIDAAHLLDAAAKEPKFAHARTCNANAYMAEWYRARGDDAQAASLQATLRAHCAPAQAVATAGAAKPAAPAPTPAIDPGGGGVAPETVP